MEVVDFPSFLSPMERPVRSSESTWTVGASSASASSDMSAQASPAVGRDAGLVGAGIGDGSFVSTTAGGVTREELGRNFRSRALIGEKRWQGK